MKIIKKKYMVFFVTIGIAGLFFSLNDTFASLIDHDDVQNDFKVGNYKGTIKEKFKEPTEEEPIKLNEKYTKEPQVANQEDVRMFTRIMILPKALSKENLLLPTEIGKDIVFDINNDWIEGGDGYYYYKKILEPTESTENVFSSVTLTNKDYVEAKISIEIKVETIAAYEEVYKSAFWNGDPNTESLEKINQMYTDELKQ